MSDTPPRSFSPLDRRPRRATSIDTPVVRVAHDRVQSIRQQLHDAIDAACDHHDAIADFAADRQLARVGETGGSTSMADMAEGAWRTMRQRAAAGWVTDFDRMRPLLSRLADRALALDPAARKPSEHVDNTVRCIACHQEIDPGAADGKCHRVDGYPLHASTCYYQVFRDATRKGITVGALIAEMASANGANG